MTIDIAHDWYTTFFTELSNQSWRQVTMPEATRADVELVQAHSGRRTGRGAHDAYRRHHGRGNQQLRHRPQRADQHYRFTRGTETVDATALHHVHTSGQIVELLSEAGFIDIHHHGDTDAGRSAACELSSEQRERADNLARAESP